MIRTGDEYRASLRDGREVWMSGERVTDVTTHPQFRPIVDARARIYDMAHEDATRERDVVRGRRRRAQCDLDAAPPHARALERQAAHGRRRLRRARRCASRGWATRRSARCGRCSTARRCWTRSTRSGRATSSVTSCAPSGRIPSTSPPTPIRRAIAPSGRRTRIPTCCCTSCGRPTTASSCAARSTRPPRRTPTRPSRSPRSRTGAIRSSRSTRSASSSRWGRRG